MSFQHLPHQQHLAFPPNLSKTKVLSLSRGEFIRAKENVILLGNSGTSKTHLAITLALCACRVGYRVRFYTASGLVKPFDFMVVVFLAEGLFPKKTVEPYYCRVEKKEKEGICRINPSGFKV
jgi:ABC-type taurine transport system ATPase subunit